MMIMIFYVKEPWRIRKILKYTSNFSSTGTFQTLRFFFRCFGSASNFHIYTKELGRYNSAAWVRSPRLRFDLTKKFFIVMKMLRACSTLAIISLFCFRFVINKWSEVFNILDLFDLLCLQLLGKLLYCFWRRPRPWF